MTVLHNDGTGTFSAPDTRPVTGGPAALAFVSNKLPGVSDGYLGVARAIAGDLALLDDMTPYAALPDSPIATGSTPSAITTGAFSFYAPSGLLGDPMAGAAGEFAIANSGSNTVTFALGDTFGRFERALGSVAVGGTPVAIAQIRLAGQTAGSPVTANQTAGTVTVLRNVSVAALTPSPASHAFAGQPLGTIGPAQALTLTNTGGAPLDVLNVSMTGADPGDFVVSSDDCGGLRVRGGLDEGCQVQVRLAPQAVGARSATLLVRANRADGPFTVSVPLTGTGLDAPVGPAGLVGPIGPVGPAGPSGPTGRNGVLVLVAYQASVSLRSVAVRYALTGSAAIRLRVTTPAKRTVTVATATGRAGTNVIRWNRRISGDRARRSTYKLTVRASAGGKVVTSSRTVRLR